MPRTKIKPTDTVRNERRARTQELERFVGAYLLSATDAGAKDVLEAGRTRLARALRGATGADHRIQTSPTLALGVMGRGSE
jgi:hypothetical protein